MGIPRFVKNNFMVQFANRYLCQMMFVHFRIRYDRLEVGTSWAMSFVSSLNDSYQETYDSWDQYVFINFTSDGSINFKGFKIEYIAGTVWLVICVAISYSGMKMQVALVRHKNT